MNSAAPADPGIERIVQAFEDATIEPGRFDHETHILVGWRYLQDDNLLDAITRFTAAIVRLTHKLGLSSKYHETITWFYLIKIAERRSGSAALDWPAFKAANPDLFTWNPGLIQKYYSESLLSSEISRRMFVFPDKAP